MTKKERLKKICEFVNNEIENENILGASLENYYLRLNINTNKSYRILGEPIEDLLEGQFENDDFKAENLYKIDNEYFKFVNCDRYNATIYSIDLYMLD